MIYIHEVWKQGLGKFLIGWIDLNFSPIELTANLTSFWKDVMPQQALAIFYFLNTYTWLSNLIMAYFAPIWSESSLTAVIPMAFSATTNLLIFECMNYARQSSLKSVYTHFLKIQCRQQLHFLLPMQIFRTLLKNPLKI